MSKCAIAHLIVSLSHRRNVRA